MIFQRSNQCLNGTWVIRSSERLRRVCSLYWVAAPYEVNLSLRLCLATTHNGKRDERNELTRVCQQRHPF
jgi:hypothetical protein